MSEQLLDRRYLILQGLNQGGFGRTFLAKDTKLPGNPICVVKQFYPANSQPELLAKAQELFIQEAEILQNLGKHPHIPRLLAYFAEKEEFYLVQEYIEGETLAEEFISKGSLSEAQVIEFLLELLEIISFVHDNNVIHRDLKPENIIRNKQNNKLVLIDFGAVKKVTTQAHQKTMAIGTPAYSPIEQLHGQPNFGSDIYAAGMLGIQAITGINFAPYLGGGLDKDSAGEIIWQPYAQVSDGLATILTKMVRHNYRDRYQSARKAIQALQNLTNNRSASTVINQKKTQNSFKLAKKILILGGITSIIIATIKVGLNNLASPKLRLNNQSITSNLERKNICENFNVSCQKYLLKGKRGQQISIEMNSDDFDPSLVLSTPDGKQLEVSEDISLNNWNAKIVANLPVSGNYIVTAKTFTQGESGAYSLQAFIETDK
jgi:serine/threonine protein kinase